MTRGSNKRVSQAARGELPPLRGIIYARASQDRKGRSISVASQVTAGRRFFKKHNIVVVAVLVDNDLSASRYAKHERQDYKEALRLLVTGDAKLLWTWENSRATRELDTFVELRSILIKVGGYWAYDDRIYDMNDPDDRIDTAEDAVDSERESEKLRKRVRRGVETRAYAGDPHGPKWWGHNRVFDRTGVVTVEIDPVTGPLAAELVRRLLGGENETVIANDFNRREIPCMHEKKWTAFHTRKLYDLARDPLSWAKLTAQLDADQMESAVTALLWLNERESPSVVARRLNQDEAAHVFPGVWTNAKVRSIALNPSLAGLRVHQGEIIGKGNWKGVIKPSEHHRVKAKLNDPERNTRKDGDRIKHLLSGILLCGQCEGGTTAIETGHRNAYRCKKNHASRAKPKTDAFVVEAVLSRLERPDAIELFRAHTDAEDELQKAVEAAQELRARLDGFTDKAAEGALSPERLARIESKLVPQIEAAEQRARQIGVAPLLNDIIGPNARKAWTKLMLVQKREVLRAIVRPRLLPTESRGRAAFDPNAIEVSWLPFQPRVTKLSKAS